MRLVGKLVKRLRPLTGPFSFRLKGKMVKEHETVGPLMKVDKSTLVPIGLLVTVVLSAISMTTWIQGSISEMRGTQEKNILILTNEMNLLKMKIEELGFKITGMSTSFVRDDDIHAWVALFKAQNPALNVPDLPKHR